ncbi:hypothetical protein LUZ61_012514 [Rhynchospora tenuis]|uniref:F-box domain-containing protein n=1 Tax=Rhynchospora tenuis TaxID=198213 RepID=A0AAD6A393_9POAL|nr:hypothetical protein LUZ61_012514 [Rhynchospora tenuis]
MAGGDRISILPLEIKISVLSRLDFKDAVRTSAVAHSWRHLWTLLPRLHLHSFVDLLGLGLRRDFGSDPIWLERVFHLVSSLRGPILDFQLAFYCCPERHSLLQRLLNLLLQKGDVETLHLQNFNQRCLAVTRLPCFHALKELDLCYCHLILPADFPGFNRLTKLDLIDTLISSEDNLSLPVNLSFPSLRHLVFTFTDFEGVPLFYAPCLEKACIFHCDFLNLKPTSEKLAQLILGLVTSVAMASSLTLGFDALKNFSLVTLPFNFTFPRLRFLSFYLNTDTMDKRMYGAFVWLLKSIPFLEGLEIELWGDDLSQTNGVAILMRDLLAKKHDGFACLDRTVRSVAIEMNKLQVTASITMAQFFLLNAKLLKELKIVFATGAEVIPSMIEELKKVEIISSDAKVVLFDWINEKNYFEYE